MVQGKRIASWFPKQADRKFWIEEVVDRTTEAKKYRLADAAAVGPILHLWQTTGDESHRTGLINGLMFLVYTTVQKFVRQHIAKLVQVVRNFTELLSALMAAGTARLLDVVKALRTKIIEPGRIFGWVKASVGFGLLNEIYWRVFCRLSSSDAKIVKAERTEAALKCLRAKLDREPRPDELKEEIEARSKCYIIPLVEDRTPDKQGAARKQLRELIDNVAPEGLPREFLELKVSQVDRGEREAIGRGADAKEIIRITRKRQRADRQAADFLKRNYPLVTTEDLREINENILKPNFEKARPGLAERAA